MHILVLGGTRFIGPPAVARLAAQGHAVTVFHRGENNAPLPEGVRAIHGDRKRLAEYAPAFRESRPDVVLDTYCLTQQDAEAVAATFRGVARRVVVLSSVDVYRARDRFVRAEPGLPDPTPLTENSPLRDRWFPYADPKPEGAATTTTYEKILVEKTLLANPDLPATVLRLPMVYGPGDYQHRCFEYLKRMDDGRPFILLPDDIATWRAPRGYVEDMGEAIARCVTDERAAGQIYHVADEANVTEAEWVRRIGRAAGWSGEIIALPNDRLPKALRHEYDARQDWSLDSTRIRRDLGYCEVVSARVAMERTIAWERANPPATINPADYDYAAEDAARAKI